MSEGLTEEWHERWPNFQPEEVACKGCTPDKPCWRPRYAVRPEGMDAIQDLRNLLNRPLRLNSVYRCAFHNAAVGGAPHSHHKQGDAFDVSVRGMDMATRNQLKCCAEDVGFSGLGFYGTFLHIDLGARRAWHSKAGRQAWNF